MRKRWIPVSSGVLVASLLFGFSLGGPAFGGEPGGRDILFGSSGEAIPLVESQDCGPQGAAPCPKAGEEAGFGGKASLSQESANAGLLPVGAPARPFVLNDPTGNPLEFGAKNGGDPVLLIFWSLFCEPCKEELPFLDEVGREYASKGLKVFTVNIDGENMTRAADQFRNMYRFEFPVAMDRKTGKKYEVADAYGVTGTPSLFLIGRDGAVRWNHAGRLDPQEFRAELDRLIGS